MNFQAWTLQDLEWQTPTILNSEQVVAIKIEHRSESNLLETEIKIYRDLESKKGFPEIIWFGIVDLKYPKEKKIKESNVLVMELLGSDIASLMDKQGGKFSLKTVLMLAEQFLERVEYIHKKNYIHQDLKPHNFLMGTGEKKAMVYLADFGLSKSCNPKM